jgi:hypothetical protein|tara:strand:+ start:181 stop:507 length:327 start_codon:yes stop_codon:yes gene_type:complete
MAAVHNLYIDQGADFSADIGIFDDFNSPWDLSGYTGAAKIKKSYYSSTSTPFTVSVNAAGTVTLALTAANTASLSEGRYLYDVVITSAGGTKTRVIEGLVTINPGVTT